jgi:hypothetical protein
VWSAVYTNPSSAKNTVPPRQKLETSLLIILPTLLYGSVADPNDFYLDSDSDKDSDSDTDSVGI